MRQTLSQLFWAGVVFLVLIFFDAFGILSPVFDWVRISTRYVGWPATYIFRQTDDFFATLTSIRDLSKQNRILTDQVQRLMADLSEQERYMLENTLLRQALEFAGESNHETIAAEIISRDSLLAEQSAVISRGSGSGIEEGQAVVDPGGTLIGVVREAREQTAMIELITSSAVTINVETSNGKAAGIVRGEHGLGLLLDLVSLSESISSGDRVVTSGLGGSFPKNLLIGEIASIRSAESDLFQKASVLPAADLRKLRFVLIITK